MSFGGIYEVIAAVERRAVSCSGVGALSDVSLSLVGTWLMPLSGEWRCHSVGFMG